MIELFDFKRGDEKELSDLVKRVYNEFVAPDYTEKGNEFFYDFIAAERFLERFEKKKNIILIAEIQKVKVGMIEIRDNNQISLMFVDKKYHRKGISKLLFLDALKRCKQRNKNLDKFYVHASPFSIPVYEKLGFSKVGEMEEQFGIKYLPMEMTLNNISTN